MRHRFFFIYLSFILSLGIFIFLSVLFIERFAAYRQYSNQVDQTYKLVFHLEQVASYLKDAETAQRGFIISRDSNFLAPMQNMPLILPLVDSVYALSQSFESKQEVNSLKKHIVDRLNLMQENQKLAIKRDTSGMAAELEKGRRVMELCREAIERIKTERLRTLTSQSNQKSFYEERAPNYFVGLMAFTGVVMLVSFLLILKELRSRLEYQRQLEKQVRELNRSNTELEQLTYVASHDLQEPIRKIRMFCNWLFVKHKHKLDTETIHMVERMDLAAERVHSLLNDIITFTNIIRTEEELTSVDLNDVVKNVQDDLKEKIEARKVRITTEPLLLVNGYSRQLFFLFRALLDNSIKFSQEYPPPVVHISSSDVTVTEQGFIKNKKQYYYKVVVSDNGIGFDNVFAEKIFFIFQRLNVNKDKYDGQGIGLAIVQRVMVNHGGYVIARGKAGVGASFELYFPAKD